MLGDGDVVGVVGVLFEAIDQLFPNEMLQILVCCVWLLDLRSY